MKLGLALSGGGVRAAAQLGIVKALSEAGIEPDIYTGTSGGSIVATLLALGYDPEEALELFKKTGSIYDVAYWHIIKGLFTSAEIKGIIKGNKLESVLESIFGGKYINEIKVPYAVVATDIKNSTETIYSNQLFEVNRDMINNDRYEWIGLGYDKISFAVRCSCSFPGVFIPRKDEFNDDMVDGGLTNNLPSDVAKALGADRVISINLANQPHVFKDTGGILSILSRSFEIIFDRDQDNNIKDHDILLTPNVDNIKVFSMDQIDDSYNLGYRYGKNKADFINSILYENN